MTKDKTRAEQVTFHVFTNSGINDIHALTFDKTGAALPTDHPKKGAKWTYWKSFTGGLEGRIGLGLEDEKAAIDDIKKQGYYIHPKKRLLKPA